MLTQKKGAKMEGKRIKRKTNNTKIEKTNCTRLEAFIGTSANMGTAGGGLASRIMYPGWVCGDARASAMMCVLFGCMCSSKVGAGCRSVMD